MLRGPAGRSRTHNRHKTKKLTIERGERENHGRVVLGVETKRQVELGEERLVLVGLPELRLSTYNYMLTQVDFGGLLSIRVKCSPIPLEIMLLLLDLMIENGPEMEV